MCRSFLCPVTVEMMAQTLLRYKSAKQMFTGIAVLLVRTGIHGDMRKAAACLEKPAMPHL